MVTWNNKLITFLSGGNVIKFTRTVDFEVFKNLMKKIGLDLGRFNLGEMIKDCERYAEMHGKTYDLGHAVIVEYDNGKGFTFGWSSEQEAESWYEMKPFTWEEIKEELKDEN